MSSKSFEADLPENEPFEDTPPHNADQDDELESRPRRDSRRSRRREPDDEYDDEENEEPKSNKKLLFGGAAAAAIALGLWYSGVAGQLYDMALGQNETPPPAVHHAPRPKLANQNHSSRRQAPTNDDGFQQPADAANTLPAASDDEPFPKRPHQIPAIDAEAGLALPSPQRPQSQARSGAEPASSPALGGNGTFPPSPSVNPVESVASKDVLDKLNSVMSKLDDMTRKMEDIEKISQRQEEKIEQGAIAVVNMSAKLDGLVGRMNDQQASIETLKDTIHATPSKKNINDTGAIPSKPGDADHPAKPPRKDESTVARPHVLRGYILKGVSEGDPPTSVFIKTPSGAIMKNINEDVGGSAGVIKEIRQVNGGSWEVVTTKGIIPAG